MEHVKHEADDTPQFPEAINRSNQEAQEIKEKNNRERIEMLRERGAHMVGALSDLQESHDLLLAEMKEKKIDPKDILMEDAVNCVFPPDESAELLWKPFNDLDMLLKQQGDPTLEVDVLEKSIDSAESAYVKIKEAIENIQGVVNQFPVLKEEASQEKDVESGE